jgi:hypothetical protein
MGIYGDPWESTRSRGSRICFSPLEFLVCDNYLNTNEILHQEYYKSTNEIFLKATSFYFTKMRRRKMTKKKKREKKN